MGRSWQLGSLVLGFCVWLAGEQAVPLSGGGTSEPNVASDVTVVADGARGPGLQCGHTQLLSYRAPGNIYARRGTLSFFWRSREPVGPTAFPIFRVGYADHSSWDMVWLRIDYNGRSGFDAFVTDASLARTRVSYTLPAFPAPAVWTHLALAWDETTGIRFYVNGAIAGAREGTPRFDAALAKGDAAASLPALERTLDHLRWRDEWWFRYGWNRPGDAPPAIDSPSLSVRKVEIHDAFDLKRWMWNGTDSIRETTSPGVYNRSRLPGRHDYFVLPDWDCYSLSGKSVTFVMPDEPWNQVEISGAAWGSAALVHARDAVAGVATRRAELGRSSDVQVKFAPRTFTVIDLRLVSKGTPYWSRPDLAIGKDDVRLDGRTLRVTVHSLGAVPAPASRVVVRDAAGREIAHAGVPSLEAPVDLRPRTATVRLALPAVARVTGGSVTVEIRGTIREITTKNNEVRF